jgi:hypothetical protein
MLPSVLTIVGGMKMTCVCYLMIFNGFSTSSEKGRRCVKTKIPKILARILHELPELSVDFIEESREAQRNSCNMRASGKLLTAGKRGKLMAKQYFFEAISHSQ